MCDYLLFENATGYALFEIIEAEDIGTNLEKVSGSAFLGLDGRLAVLSWGCVGGWQRFGWGGWRWFGWEAGGALGRLAAA